jgi:hypothetical protein
VPLSRTYRSSSAVTFTPDGRGDGIAKEPVSTSNPLRRLPSVSSVSTWSHVCGGVLSPQASRRLHTYYTGAGTGLLNLVIADVAVSIVPKERSGMAAGINDTFRQVGIAVGIAVWGAIFVGRGADKVRELATETPAASGERSRELVEAAA